MTPDQERLFHRLESRVDELTRRVQQLETERHRRTTIERAERHYTTLNRDKEAPGSSLGIRDQEDDGS
jgi:hypothetical protein